MNHKHLFRSLGVALLGAALLWAGDPWTEKPYTEWTAEDLRNVLRKSPWGKQVSIRLGGTSAGIGEVQGAQLDRKRLRERVSGARSEPLPLPNLGLAQERILVQWVSSLTMREALVRQLQLEGTANQEVTGRLLSLQSENYDIVVSPLLSSMAEGGMMHEDTYLESKGSGERVRPVKVRMIMWPYSGAGEPVKAVALSFPRYLGDVPVNNSQEEQVRLHCRLGSITIEKDFDLREMVRDGKPDL